MKSTVKYNLAVICLSLLSLQNLIAAEIISSNSGVWTNANTWVGGVVPTKSDNVTIAAGHTVTYFVVTGLQVDLCTNLIVDGTLQASTMLNNVFVTNIYGTILCNGIIEPGLYDGAKGISAVLKGDTASVAGTGVITVSTLNLAVESTTCNIDIPKLTLSDSLCISKNNAKFSINQGAEVSMSAKGIVTVTNNAKQNSFNINGKLTTGYIKLEKNAVNTGVKPVYSIDNRHNFLQYNTETATLTLLKEMHTLKLFNLEGKCVYKQNNPPMVTQLNPLIKGVYVVLATDNEGVSCSAKIIVL